MYSLSCNSNITVYDVFDKGFENMKFRRCLKEETLRMWFEILDKCSQIQLKAEPDKVKWLLSRSGVFSVKSAYHMEWQHQYGSRADRKSTRLNSSHITRSRMPSSA